MPFTQKVSDLLISGELSDLLTIAHSRLFVLSNLSDSDSLTSLRRNEQICFF